jgi:DNA polymerase I-like protein with 3'-5' exonuclease and polymerase domains
MHAATNSLLQSAGAIVMKKALVLLDKSLKSHGIPYAFVANVHDEFQIEVPEAYVDIVGMAGVRAIKNAGINYNMRCPLDAEYKVGNNWAETH